MSVSDWDAEKYSRVASPQQEWAEGVLGRLDLRGDEAVLDAGCGSGGVTELLLELLPRGTIVAVDGSPAMVEAASKRIDDPRVSFSCQDLTDLELADPVDRVFSNATFHWVSDHRKLFARLFAALKPGGRISAQCGGAGNVADLVEALRTVTTEAPFRETVGTMDEPWNFATPEQTRSRLRESGFEVVDCWLEERRATPDDPQEFLEASGLSPYRERLAPDQFRAFSDRLMEVMGWPEGFDYVRLNIEATRPKEATRNE
jgi:trans-aconitate 2-methyltransferase